MTCPDCGAFGGCDCAEEPPAVAKNVYTSPREPAEDFDDSDFEEHFCWDCGRELPDPTRPCPACAMHERHREISRREMDSLARIAAMNRRLSEPKPETQKE